MGLRTYFWLRCLFAITNVTWAKNITQCNIYIYAVHISVYKYIFVVNICMYMHTYNIILHISSRMLLGIDLGTSGYGDQKKKFSASHPNVGDLAKLVV